ncbi:unnamed protein product [Candidula unifasciata]|uniref:Uncharacterized protein n=1 Tax=Candidula unifasciata TaxID=100452 RepID=A0A8S3ZIH8_9EUPU|nr:unnamed protein product [Candidula unifasciata]
MSFQVPPDFKEDKQLFLDVGDSENTDVFLLRVPKGFDITRLDGVEFSNNEIKEIGVEEGANQLTCVYELGAFCGKGLDLSALIKSGQTVALGSPISEFVAVNKSYRSNVVSPPSSQKGEASTSVPMPDGLRVRFTPFGAGTPFRHTSGVKKKKKRKRKHSDNTLTEVSTPDILHMHKRRKLETEADSPQHEHRHKKHKHKKKER